MKKKEILIPIIISLCSMNGYSLIRLNEKNKEIILNKKIFYMQQMAYKNRYENEIEKYKVKKEELKKENILLKNQINQIEKIKEEEKKKEITKDAIVSYYTHLPDEGGGLGITASGEKISNTSVAIPRKDDLLQFGDTIIFETLSPKYMKDYNGQYLTRVADDTGNPRYIRKIDNNTYKLDVYCPKLPNETNYDYKKRVRGYGITNTKIKIIDNE